jgi:hypothetical protein
MSVVEVIEEMYPGMKIRRRRHRAAKPESPEEKTQAKQDKPPKTDKPEEPAASGGDSPRAEQMELQLGIPPAVKKPARKRSSRTAGRTPEGDTRYTMSIVGAVFMDNVKLAPGERLVVVKLTPVADKA